MNSASSVFAQSELSLAAYANLTPGVDPVLALQDNGKGMSDKQAKNFATTYSVVKQYNDSLIEGGLDSGLSVTIFQNNETKQLTVAIRGTEIEDYRDVITDAVMIDKGVAYNQVVALYNWWKRETTPDNQQVTQYRVTVSIASPSAQAINLGDNFWLEMAGTVNATGGLIPALAADPDHKVEVTGHSLGGHLAMAFSTLFAPFTTQATVFNAPGFKDTAANQAFFAALGGTVPTGGPIINIIADEANIGNNPLNVAAGINSRPGTAIGVAIENQWQSDETATPAALNHSQQTLTDALAVYAMLGKLDPALTTASFKHILNAEVYGTAGSLEGIVDAIEKVLGIDNNRMPTGNANRDLLFQALDRMQNGTGKAAYEAAIGSGATLRDLSIFGANQIASIAKDNIAYRYALKAGNSFALIGVDYATLHNQNGELTLYDKTTGQGELTEEWIADRSKFLTWMIKANTLDKTTVSDGGSEQWAVEDKTLKGASDFLPYSLDINSGLFGTTGNARKMIFGKDTDDSGLLGGDKNDRIYGGSGNDTLDGGKGADYLEGNAGSDTLDGGKGSDSLNGGFGFDTYKVGGGNGWDWIEDQDGIGKILYADSQGGADIQLTGGTPVEGTANVWKQESNGKTIWYILTDWTENGETFQRLSIEGPDGGVFIKAWSAGQLGIILPGAQAQTPAPAVLVGTAGTDKLHAEHNESVITGNGGADLLEAGNVSTAIYADVVIPDLTQYAADTAQLAGGGTLEAGALQGGSVLIGSHGGDDTLVGGTGNDALFGGSGRDQLIGGGGADFILGDGIYRPLLTPGDGAYTGWQLAAPSGDFAITGSGFTEAVYSAGHPANDDADIIHGGGGNDMAWGGFGDDLIFGEGGDDWLVGASGSDLIDGGDGNDLLVGEADTFDGPAGNDILLGGKGNDNLYGYTGNDRLQGGDDNDLLVGDMPSGLGIGVDGSLDGNDFLDGESGSDTLFGGGKDDELHGGSGNDFLYGDGSEIIGAHMGKDTLDGGDGNDELSGDGNDDHLFGGNDDDRLFGDNSTTPLANQGNDYLDGGNGNDYLRGYGGDDILLGGAGMDSLLGDAGNDQLDGGGDNDTLYGGDGNNTLYGGDGNDLLAGGSSDDVYIFSAGDGSDVIEDASGLNRVRFEGIAPNSIAVSQAGDAGEYLRVSYGTEDAIYIKDGWTGAIQTFEFDDLSFDLPGLLALSKESLMRIVPPDGGTAFGAGGDDNLVGGGGDDTLQGGAGNDLLQGGLGSDTYLFGRGDGQDIISARDANDTGLDVLSFGAGVAAADLAYYRLADDSLLLRINGTQDSVQLKGWFSAGPNVSLLRFESGAEVDAAAVSAQAAPYQGGTTLDDCLVGTAFDDRILSFEGDDTLVGGAGNDLLEGGRGADTYHLGWSTGTDRLIDASEETSTVALQSGVTLSSLRHRREGDSLLISVNGSDSAVVLSDYYITPQSWIIREEDGTDTAVSNWLAMPDSAVEIGVIWGEFLDLYRSKLSASLSGYTRTGKDVWEQETVGGLSSSRDIQRLELATQSSDALEIRRLSDQYSPTVTTSTEIARSLPNTTPPGIPTQQFITIAQFNALLSADANGISTNGLTPVYGPPEAGKNAPLVGFLTNTGASVVPGATEHYFFTVSSRSQVLEQIYGGSSDNVINGKKYDWGPQSEVTLIDGGAGNDTLYASGWIGRSYGYRYDNESGMGGLLYGNDGNDKLYGGHKQDWLIGGNGDDYLDGSYSSDTYYVFRAQQGTDTVFDTGAPTDLNSGFGGRVGERPRYEELADYYYASVGIDNWSENYTPQAWGPFSPLNSRYLVVGLPPLPAADDFEWTSKFVDAGLLPADQINFTDGIAQNDLSFTWSREVLESPRLGGNWDSIRSAHDVLAITFAPGNTVRVILPNAADALGTGIEQFSFDDGSLLSMQEMLELAPARPEHLPSFRYAADGVSPISLWGLTDFSGIDFDAAVSATDIAVSRDGVDLVLTQVTNNPPLRLLGWYADPGNTPQFVVTFATGEVWSSAELTEYGLTQHGTTGDDMLIGLPVFSDALFGLAGNDTLNGGGGDDTMVGGAGDDSYVVDSASDIVTESLNEGTDLVQSNATYTLAANVENLTLTGTTAINGTGNALDNVLTGNSAINTLNGGSGNDTLDGGAGNDTMVGGLGDDTYVVDNTADVIIETASEGTDTVSSSVTLTLAANVENLILTETAAINGTGNTSNNVITGNAGNNTLSGGIGTDSLIGGSGNDTYIVDNVGDVVTESLNEGTDLVQSTVTYTLSGNVENLTLTGTTAINGTGNALNNVLTGNSANNTLTGGDGNDTLDGGTGNDTMVGGLGDDVYVVNVSTDVVTEAASAGNDTVQSSITLTLATNIENLVLTGTSAINGTGNTLNNTLTGNGAANTLSGGTGADTMIGGAGNDTYVVDNTGDAVTENTGEGADLVQSRVTYTLAANVESLTLTGTTAINGTGNALDNVLTGNSANNTLTGGDGNDTLNGGTGNDTMVGGLGDDLYVVNVSTDVVTEAAGAGTDTVQSSVTLTLAANVENLTLIGTTAINGTGNALDNVLTGNSANNTLTGGDGNDTLDGGTGNDTMVGGLGDDVYVLNVSTDVVTEVANAGNDTVQSGVTLTLAANVENLMLTGASAINGTGNTLNNLVRGNTGINTLNGGVGNDILEGGDGNDILTDTAGTALFNGGAGNDTINGGTSAEIFLGGAGNDTYTTAAGNDIILFNKGDGQDTFATGGTGSDTLSLGGGINYTDLSFSKSSSDLILKTGDTEQITFKNWYAATPSRSVANLQAIADAMAGFSAGGSDPLKDQKVENFNFAGLVGAFDAARTADAGLTSWALTNALSSFQLAGSDTAALGGDLAYQYGSSGTLAGIGVVPALATLSNPALGTSAQTLTPLSGLQTGTARLS